MTTVDATAAGGGDNQPPSTSVDLPLQVSVRPCPPRPAAGLGSYLLEGRRLVPGGKLQIDKLTLAEV